MTYTKGNVAISITQIDSLGKNPSLLLRRNETNDWIKVASFGSESKARQFCKWLDYMLGLTDEGSVKCE